LRKRSICDPHLVHIPDRKRTLNQAQQLSNKGFINFNLFEESLRCSCSDFIDKIIKDENSKNTPDYYARLLKELECYYSPKVVIASLEQDFNFKYKNVTFNSFTSNKLSSLSSIVQQFFSYLNNIYLFILLE